MLTEKGFNGLIGKIQRVEGTLRSLVQDAVEDSLSLTALVLRYPHELLN